MTSQVVAERIMPMMTEEEIEAANLTVDNITKKTWRLHCGLKVGESKASVLKGGNYKEFRRRSFVAASNTVEMWAFRGEDGHLFLAIGNQINLEISL
ncbi:hypothetical protein KSP39_PZI002481 [Platanthera zijinensis]|uniref:Uncharacterized protein n=1 Tax=Platanthera zijinensis TaxID=2320716 RepID=A0AAP0GE57_9ASPA